MKRLLITSAGGSPATNFVRSLRLSPEQFYLVGTDCDPYNILRSETDKSILIPKYDDHDYIDFINDITKEDKLEFLHAQNDFEINVISQNRNKININTFLPKHSTILDCQNKYNSHLKWKKVGLPQPSTFICKNPGDLQKAFSEIPGKKWVRYIGTGAGATGALPTQDYQLAESWLNLHNGWGNFTVSETLTKSSVTWQSIWKDGELVIAQSRKRLSWELGSHILSGVSGSTGSAITISDKLVDTIAEKAIFAIDKQPNGIFSVDMTYDYNNVPNPTEINIARFFTTNLFFTKAGLNMPYLYVKLAYRESIPEIAKKINPLPPGLLWIRGIDFFPVLNRQDEVDNILKKFNESRKKLSQK